ncbi:MAG: tetratricopeptide repeat protein [Planctomycetes bacterium]|nr:tetratricopeptide repeat protein [Planctomycetota bacterium]
MERPRRCARRADLAGAPAVALAGAPLAGTPGGALAGRPGGRAGRGAIALARDPGARSSARSWRRSRRRSRRRATTRRARTALHLAAGEHAPARARLDEALAHAEQALAGAGPAALEAHHLRATCLAQLRRDGDAAAARRALLALDPPEPHALLARAGLAEDERPDDAAPLLREALALEPWRHQARLRLLSALMQLGRLDEVDAELARLEAEAPADDQLVHLVRGIALTRRGRPDEALAALDRAVALGEPAPDPAALLARGGAHLARGDRAAARADLDRSLRAREDVLGLVQRGALSAEEGRAEDAEADWRRAHGLDPERADRLVERLEPAGLRRHACHAVGLLEAGPGPLELSARARDRLERLAEQVTPTSARRRLAAALHAAGSGHPFRRFEPALRRGLELAPTSWPAALVAARLLAGRDLYDEALAELARARRLGAPMGPVELLRGEVLWLRGDGNEAVRAWEALAREAPTSGEGRCAAGWVASARGDMTGAVRAAEALVVACPDLTSAAVLGGAVCGAAREWASGRRFLARALDAEGALTGFVPVLLAVNDVEVTLEAAAQRGGAPGPDFDEAMRRLVSLHALGHAMPRLASARLALTAGAAGGRWFGRVVRWLDEAERAEPTRGEVDVWRGLHALLRPDGAADEALACWRAARSKTPRILVPNGYLELFRRRFGDDPFLAELAPR